MGNLVFNGVSTVDMGVVIQTPPVYEIPSRVYEITSIPGRSGDLIIDKQSFQNVTRKYYLALGFRRNSNFVTNAKMLVEWLLSVSGYARLEDSYEPDYYRIAAVQAPDSLLNLYDEATAVEVSFNCKPQRYLKSGEIPIIVENFSTIVKITNNTKCIALPKILVEGTGGVNLEIRSGLDWNNYTNISVLTSSFNNNFTIDSDMQDCYSSTDYVNNLVTLTNGFPKLYPGNNWLQLTGTDLRKLEITPRWWTL